MQLVTTARQAVDFPTRRDGNMKKRKALGPERAAELNPFLSLMEDWMRAPGGYVEHIHRGYETVTLVLEGEVACTGPHGRASVLLPGDAQWVSAGHGHSHSELPNTEVEAHLLQLWLNLPAANKRDPARVQDLRTADIPVLTAPGRTIRVLAGEFEGKVGPATVTHPVRLLDVRLEQGAAFELPIPAGQRGLVYVVSGDAVIAMHVLRAGGVVELASKTSDVLPLAATSPAHLLVMTAAPLEEPVEVSGPFILNSKAEVKKAYDDFRGGFFDQLP